MHNSFSVASSRATTDGWCGQQQQQKQELWIRFDCELANLAISTCSQLSATRWSRSRISITTSRRDANAQVPELWNIVSCPCPTGSCNWNHNPQPNQDGYFSQLPAAARWAKAAYTIIIIITLPVWLSEHNIILCLPLYNILHDLQTNPLGINLCIWLGELSFGIHDNFGHLYQVRADSFVTQSNYRLC